ncbi:MAG: hypothetical protein EBU49_01170 [Proteobacteria bacterium]|nr:hypothetical protein [Pseudomonadota bacterium]
MSIIGLGEFEGTEPGTGKGNPLALRAGFCFEPALKELSEQAAKAAITANSTAPIEKDFFLASENIQAS